MKKRETATPNNTFGEWAKRAIETHFEKTIQYEAEVLEDRDPEALHQMRVGMRRLRSAIAGFAPALDLPKEAGEKAIGKLSRSLGTLRDLDVLLEALETRYQPTLPKAERATFESALQPLKKERADAFQQVSSTLKDQRYLSFKETVSAWLKDPQYQPMAQLPIQDVLPDLLLPEVSHLLLHPGWEVGIKLSKKGNAKIENLDAASVEKTFTDRGEILHDLRKQVKRVRYQMSLFTDFYGDSFAAYVADMKAIQEILGQMQDSVVLADTLTRVLQADIREKLPTLAEKLAETRYESWLEWQPLHQKYLKSETRTDLRSQLLHPLPLSDGKNAKSKKKKS